MPILGGFGAASSGETMRPNAVTSQTNFQHLINQLYQIQTQQFTI